MTTRAQFSWGLLVAAVMLAAGCQSVNQFPGQQEAEQAVDEVMTDDSTPGTCCINNTF